MITKGKYLTRDEIWFDDEELSSADIIVLHQSKKYENLDVAETFHTLIIDLNIDEDCIFSFFKKNTQYEIRRSKNKDNVQHKICDDKYDLENFFYEYNEFAKSKKLSKISKSFIENLIKNNKFCLTAMIDLKNSKLTWHAYYLGLDRVRLLYSVSSVWRSTTPSERSFIGRVNRYHHWLDILNFKNANFKIYDFGGWYVGSADIDKIKINNFKSEFGGNIEKSVNCILYRTLKSKCFQIINYLKNTFL